MTVSSFFRPAERPLNVNSFGLGDEPVCFIVIEGDREQLGVPIRPDGSVYAIGQFQVHQVAGLEGDLRT